MDRLALMAFGAPPVGLDDLARALESVIPLRVLPGPRGEVPAVAYDCGRTQYNI